MAVTSRLRIETITSGDAMLALAPEWRNLFVESGSGLPFGTFDWADTWWKYMRQDRRAIRDTLQLRALRTQEGRLVAVAPLVLTERPATGPLRVRFLQFLGADPNMTELRGMLALPEFERDAYETLAKDVQNGPWDWVRWSGLREGSGAEEVVGGSLTIRGEPIPNLLLDPLPPTWEEFREGLKRNIRESLRKCYNSLKRDEHSFDLRIARAPGEVGPAIDRFLVLHGSRAEADVAVRHNNVFGARAAQDFLYEICRRFAAEDITRIFQLVIGGEIVATRIGFQFGDTLYLYYSGYDPEWGKYSVMTTTVAEAIKYAIDQKLKTVNLSTGRDVSKTRWGPSEVEYAEGVQVASSPRSRLAYEVYQQGSHLRDHKLANLLAR